MTRPAVEAVGAAARRCVGPASPGGMAPPTIELQGFTFALDGDKAGLLASTSAKKITDEDPGELRRIYESQGYLLLRNLLPVQLVAAVEAEIRSAMAAREATDPGRTMLSTEIADGMMNSEAFRRVSQGPELFRLFDTLFAEESVTLDYKHFRCVGPGGGTPFHVDRTYMGRGSRRLTTAWVPWHDIDLQMGGLAVVEGSHKLAGFQAVRATYAEQEVHGMLTTDPMECLSYDASARWLTADFRAGDVLVFPMDLLHGSCTNRTAEGASPRLSSDIRFQPRADAVDNRNSAHGFGEDYTWDKRNYYYSGGSRPWEAETKLPGLGAPEYRQGPMVPPELDEAKRTWGLVGTSHLDYRPTQRAAL